MDLGVGGERKAAESIIGDIMVEYPKRRSGAGADDAEPAENKAKTGSSAAAPDAVPAKEVAVMPALKAKPAAVEGKDAKTGASKAKPVAVEGKDAKTERSELERLHKPTKVWKRPYFHCGNFNPRDFCLRGLRQGHAPLHHVPVAHRDEAFEACPVWQSADPPRIGVL